MKKNLLISFMVGMGVMTIPFVITLNSSTHSEVVTPMEWNDLFDTRWDVKDDKGNREIITFHRDGTFTYFVVHGGYRSHGMSFGDEDDSWRIRGINPKKGVYDFIISYNDGFQIKTGFLEYDGKYMEGTLTTEYGEWGWSGTKLEDSLIVNLSFENL